MFDDIHTLEDVRQAIVDGYRIANPPRRLHGGAGVSKPLPLAIAEPGPLMARAIEVGGHEGLTMQHLRVIFDQLGTERFDRGVAQLRASAEVEETKELRPNKAGRDQMQVVFRPRSSR